MGSLLDIFEGHSVLVMVISGLSLMFFVLSLISIPWIIKRIPVDYFIRTRERCHGHAAGPARLVLVIARNVFGAILLAAGLLMLITPGQGLLTILLGIAVMDFPGKRRLELYFLEMDSIRNALNFVRKKQGMPPLLFQMSGTDDS